MRMKLNKYINLSINGRADRVKLTSLEVTYARQDYCIDTGTPSDVHEPHEVTFQFERAGELLRLEHTLANARQQTVNISSESQDIEGFIYEFGNFCTTQVETTQHHFEVKACFGESRFDHSEPQLSAVERYILL